jgi:DNA-binding CsgD family transcriptional regulator
MFAHVRLSSPKSIDFQASFKRSEPNRARANAEPCHSCHAAKEDQPELDRAPADRVRRQRLVPARHLRRRHSSLGGAADNRDRHAYRPFTLVQVSTRLRDVVNVVGRERELSLAEEFLDSAGDHFAVLVLEGEPGIGKTTVWREVIRRAQERSFVVLSCRPAATEAKLGLSAVADVLEPVPETAFGALLEPQRHALEVALLRADPGDAVADPRTVATAVRSLLTELASDAPVLLAVDDVQWLDSASAATLAFVLRRLSGERIGFLASRRLSEPALLRMDELVAPEVSARVTIGPLSLAGLQYLLKERLASPPSRSVLVRIDKASGGNPLFALEIGRVLDELGVPAAGEPLPVPSDVQALVRARLSRLRPPTRELLLLSAALEDAREETVSFALGRPIGHDLEPAEREQIARCERGLITFTHPLFAAATVASASGAERRRAHRRLADAVGGSERRARHLALSVEGRDEPTAVAVHAAARDALFRGAPAAAAELVELALRLGKPDSQAQRRRTLDLATYLLAAGERVRAREVLEEVDSWTRWPPRLQARAVARLCQLVCETEQPASAIAFLERKLREPFGVEARAAIHGGLSYSISEVDAARAAKHAHAGLALLEPLGEDTDPWVHATALYMRLRAGVLIGQGLDRDLIDRIRGIEERLPPERRAFDRASPSIAYWLKHVDDLDASRTWLERSLREAVDGGNETGELNVLAHLAITECWAGNLELARHHAVSASNRAEELGSAFSTLLAEEALALVHAHLGNADEVRAIVGRRPPPSSATRHGTLLFRAALGLVELSLGNNEAADTQLQAGLQSAERVACREPGMHRMHANAAEAAVALGDLQRAEEIANFVEEHGKRTNHRWSLATGARARALVAAARGELEDALAAAEQALERHEQLPMPFERARTLLVKGRIERRVRRRGRAKESFEQALEIFEHLGARLWADRARAELERIGLRRTSAADLTEGERRVAELAAQGLTNRQVATALFMSPKTVEANLSRAYRKLGISSRAELGAHMTELVQT